MYSTNSRHISQVSYTWWNATDVWLWSFKTPLVYYILTYRQLWCHRRNLVQFTVKCDVTKWVIDSRYIVEAVQKKNYSHLLVVYLNMYISIYPKMKVLFFWRDFYSRVAENSNNALSWCASKTSRKKFFIVQKKKFVS